jgi:hypothetical protein
MIIIVLLVGAGIGIVIHLVSDALAVRQHRSEPKPNAQRLRPLGPRRQRQVIDLKLDALQRNCLPVPDDLLQRRRDLDERIDALDDADAKTWRWLRWIVVPIVILLAVLWLNGFGLQLGQDIVYSFARH